MKARYGPLMAEMTWQEVRDAASEGFGVLLPVGSTEQHGPHLPLATDVLIPLALAEGVAAGSGMVVAPPIAYGYQSKPLSGGGQGFPGTLSLRGATFTSLLRDVVGEVIRSGFKKIVILNWHYENMGFTYEGADLAMRQASDPSVRLISIENPLAMIDQDAVAALFPEGFPGYDIEHAAVIETSLMLALNPGLVRRDRIIDDQSQRHPAYDMIPAPPDTIPASGVLYRASLASEEKGRQLYEMLVESILSAIDTELTTEEPRARSAEPRP
jgi:creatinine amidohydrolase